jgi:hypothetical protein
MASGENTAEERRDERRDYLAQRFPRVSPEPLGLGQLSGVQELGSPSEMRLFAPGPRALDIFRAIWVARTISASGSSSTAATHFLAVLRTTCRFAWCASSAA